MSSLFNSETADTLVSSGCYINTWNELTGVLLPDGSQVPAYLSCRRLFAQTAARQRVEVMLNQTFDSHFRDVDLVVGLATAGIPWAHSVASHAALPLSYVRGATKGYGVGELVEGNPHESSRALLIDDTIFSGSSLESAITALRIEKNISVVGILAIANLSDSEKTYGEEHIRATTLTGYRDVCASALCHGVLDRSQYEMMLRYYANPKDMVF